MSMKLNSNITLFSLSERIKAKEKIVIDWLESLEKSLPLYSSVDIRDSGYKAAVVDTNIFPSGFNNLCEHGVADTIKFIKQSILTKVPNAKNILIIAEEHTRNKWYMENVRILQNIIESAGFSAQIATFLELEPKFCETMDYAEIETATGNPVKIYCFQKILSKIKISQNNFDMIILNNDLTAGLPDILKNLSIPIYPSAFAGWHSRSKSNHFSITHDLINSFSKILNIDPWLLSCLFETISDVNINNDSDRKTISNLAVKLFKKIAKKYNEHNIDEKPYILLKSDTGTYGMGVVPIEDPSEIIDLNRKKRNQLYKGKSSQIINKFILQEGIPTVYNIDKKVSEIVLYQIENNLVGGFYRSHNEKSVRENLNSPGMILKKTCPHSENHRNCGTPHNKNKFLIYKILGRIAAIAAQKEIIQLEGKKAGK